MDNVLKEWKNLGGKYSDKFVAAKTETFFELQSKEERDWFFMVHSFLLIKNYGRMNLGVSNNATGVRIRFDPIPLES